MPKNEFILAGKKFITSKKAAALFGYTQDYVGQLCRGEKVDARRVGRTWYVSEKSILEHKRLFNGATVLKKEEIAPKDAKKLSVVSPESDSGKLQVGSGENEIPKIGFGFATPKSFNEASRVASEFQYTKEPVPILPELQRSTFEPKKFTRSFFQKSLSLALAFILVVGSYVYHDKIFVEAARGFRAVQEVAVVAVQKIQRLNFSEHRKVQPFFEQQPKLSWIDSKISAEQVAATFGSEGFVDSDKLAEAVSGATGLADFNYFENFTAKQSAVASAEADKLLVLIEKVLPEKQQVALENVAETTYETLYPIFQKTGSFFASLFGKKIDGNLAVNQTNETVIIPTTPSTPPPSSPYQGEDKGGVSSTVVLSPRNIIEEVTKNISYTGVSREEFESRLANLSANIFGQLATLSTATSNNNTYINNVYSTVAGTNNIDMLHNVDISDSSTFTNGTITDSPISGSTGSFTSFSGETLSVSGSSSLSTTTISNDLTVDTDTLYVDSTNNRVGIGTSSPTDTLSVSGPIFLSDVTPTDTSNRLYANASSLYWAGNLIGGATTANWTTDGTHAWRATGNVGIGTTSPYAKLSVEGSSALGNSALAGYFTSTSTTATNALSGILTVGGAFSASSTADILGLSTLRGGFVSLASSSINNDLTVTGNLFVNGTPTYTGLGTTTFAGGIRVTGGLSATQGIEAPFFVASSTATSTFAGGLST
ncbi:MAG: hypothetical protein WC673_01515, partial [Candidatus Paceibacterota bacterium]